MKESYYRFVGLSRDCKSDRSEVRSLLAVALAFGLYIAIRLLFFSGVLVLESHDSAGYLRQIEVFRSLSLAELGGLDADLLPFYPAASALLSFVVGNVEFAARLSSLIASAFLFLAVLGIARRLSSMVAVLAGLVFLSLNPTLIRLSYSVLTEPTYIAIIYVGLWMFVSQFQNPKYWKAAVLGIIFGLGFLCRVEGILYVAFIPAMQLIHYVWWGNNVYDIKKTAAWSAVYISFFALIAVPQIWHVSEKVEGFALNGRQVWAVILNADDGKSYEEKLYGLDYSPSQINRIYLQENRYAREALSSERNTSVVSILKVGHNGHILYSEVLGELIGPFLFALFIIGLLHLYMAGAVYPIILILGFIAVGIAGPLIHNVAIRHVIIIAPLTLLVAGIGVEGLLRYVMGTPRQNGHDASRKRLVAVCVVALAVLPWYGGLYYNYTEENRVSDSYNPRDFQEPVRIIKEIAEREFNHKPRLVARRGYLATFTGSERLRLPHTDYEGLVRYMDLNHADFLFLEERREELARPFYQAFSQNEPLAEFDLIYRARDSEDQIIALYRFVPPALRGHSQEGEDSVLD